MGTIDAEAMETVFSEIAISTQRHGTEARINADSLHFTTYDDAILTAAAAVMFCLEKRGTVNVNWAGWDGEKADE